MLNINDVLERLNKNYTLVTDNIANPYYFSDEPDDPDNGPYTNINDGGQDMYDEGNCLNTNLTQNYNDITNDNVSLDNSIPYTHTQAPELNPDTSTDWDDDYVNPPKDGSIADGSDYFGSGSQYFTNMYPNMFVMGATGINISEFSITGNIGADGSGDYEVNIFTLTSGNKQFTCFNKQVYNQGDPSINQFIFVPGNGAGIDHLYDTGNEDDDHCIQNLTGINEIYFLLLAKQIDVYMDESERLEIAQSFLDLIVGNEQKNYLQPVITFRVKTYDPIVFVGTLPPDGNRENIINQLLSQTVYIPGWPHPLKHGDEFTLYGKAASDLRRKLPQLNVGGTVLEIVPEKGANNISIFIDDNYVDYVSDPGEDSGHEASLSLIHI